MSVDTVDEYGRIMIEESLVSRAKLRADADVDTDSLYSNNKSNEINCTDCFHPISVHTKNGCQEMVGGTGGHNCSCNISNIDAAIKIIFNLKRQLREMENMADELLEIRHACHQHSKHHTQSAGHEYWVRSKIPTQYSPQYSEYHYHQKPLSFIHRLVLS